MKLLRNFLSWFFLVLFLISAGISAFGLLIVVFAYLVPVVFISGGLGLLAYGIIRLINPQFLLDFKKDKTEEYD